MLPPNIRYSLLIILLVGTIAKTVEAKDLGFIGETYSIAEVDLLQEMEAKAQAMEQNGQLADIQNKMAEQIQAQMDRPIPVENISRTVKERSYLYDPLQNSPVDIPKHVPRQINFNETWLFYNADDRNQVAWAQSQDKALKGNDKLILVNGSLSRQQALFNKQIFFDQNGVITYRLGITHVPAMVTQENNQLRIHEVTP